MIARGLSRAELGLRRPDSWPRALGFTLGMLVALLIAESLLESLLHGAREQGLEPAHWDPSKALPFALNAAVVVIAAPIVEELTFRGVGFRLLVPFGTLVAVFGTALAFAADHGLVEGFPALFLFGLAVVRRPHPHRQPLPGDDAARHLQCVRARGRRRPVARLCFRPCGVQRSSWRRWRSAPAAHAAPPAVTAQATPANGAAPLQVTLTAAGDAATYHWDLGDGATADGPVVQHTYAAGHFTARVTATNVGGETSTADRRDHRDRDHARRSRQRPLPAAGPLPRAARPGGEGRAPRALPGQPSARDGARRAAAAPSSCAAASAHRTRATPFATRARSRTRSRWRFGPGSTRPSAARAGSARRSR